jgi:ABC-type sugar transport system, permease component
MVSAKSRASSKLSGGERAFSCLNYVLMVLVGLVTLYPIYYILIYSLNVGADSMKGGLYLWPRRFTLYNYQLVLGNENIRHAYLITIIRVAAGTFLGLAVTGLAAYGLSFRQMPFRKLLSRIILIPMLFSGGIVPYYLVLRDTKLLNTIWVYIIPTAFSTYNMFVMRSFFMGIPDSLREAAEIDGANPLKIFFRIIIPNSMAMIAAIGLFIAVWHWNDWFSGAFYVSSVKLMPVQTILQQLLQASDLSLITGSNAESAFRSSQQTQISLMSIKMTTVMVSTLPILVAYPFLQRFFISGVLIGSVKE